MRILVTGASGLLGLNLALELARDHTVTGVANSTALQTEAFTVLRENLAPPGAVERLLDQTQPDWVINCAALALVDRCESEPELAHQLNTELPRKLAAHVARGGARLVHISTDAVFDGQRGGYTEQDPPNPLGVYGQTKLAGERAVAQANPQAIIARVNLFGWSLTGKRSLAEFFFYNLQAAKPVMGFTDVYFCPLLANDLAQILARMLSAGLEGLYHVVSSQCTTKYDFGVAIARKFGFDPHLITRTSVEQAGLKAVRSPKLTLRIDKLAQAFNQPAGDTTPALGPSLERFYALHQQGYPQWLKSLAV